MRNAPRQLRRGLAPAIVALLTAAAHPACAQEFFSTQFVAPTDEWLVLDLGGIVNRFDSSFRLDGATTTGTPINLEGNGAEKNISSFEAALIWRFLPKHRVNFQYFGADRSGSRNYTSEIIIGDAQYPLGATVSVDAKTQFLVADYMYSFVRQPGFEASVIAGIYGGKVEYDINAVGNAGSVTGAYHKTVSTSIPLPVLGVSAEWSPASNLKFGALFKGMKANIGDVDGHIYIGELTAEWMMVRGFGIGARYRHSDLAVDVGKSDFMGTADWKSNSVSLYGKFVF